VQQQKCRRLFWAGLSVKDGEPVYLNRAIKCRMFHQTFLMTEWRKDPEFSGAIKRAAAQRLLARLAERLANRRGRTT
jgi:hypothetical protein